MSITFSTFSFSDDNLSPLQKHMDDSLGALTRFKQSKKEARTAFNIKVRAEARAAGKSEAEIRKMPFLPSPHIHSYGTYSLYRYAVVIRFGQFVERRDPTAKTVKYTRRYAREYIQSLIDGGMSPSTVALHTSALAKLYRCRAQDIHDNRLPRISADFSNSRSYSESSFESDVKKRGDIAVLGRIIGVRRSEYETLCPEHFLEDSDGKLYLELEGRRNNTKGGRSRIVPVLDRNQEVLRGILATYPTGEPICPKLPLRLRQHAIRSLFAVDMYLSLARPIEDLIGKTMKLQKPRKDTRKDKYHTTVSAIYRRKDGMLLDRAALIAVSKALGHNRPGIVATSYLYRLTVKDGD
jgi:hypothetical protein